MSRSSLIFLNRTLALTFDYVPFLTFETFGCLARVFFEIFGCFLSFLDAAHLPLDSLDDQEKNIQGQHFDGASKRFLLRLVEGLVVTCGALQ